MCNTRILDTHTFQEIKLNDFVFRNEIASKMALFVRVAVTLGVIPRD